MDRNPQERSPDRDTPHPARSRVWRLLMVALVLALLLAPLLIWRQQLGRLFDNREQVLATVRSAGAWGPLLIIGLVVAQAIVAPLPGQTVNFAAGYVYGFWQGVLYSWIGSVIGTALAMSLARLAGRPLVSRLLDPAILERLDRLAEGKGLRFFFLFFLIPFLPDDLVAFLAGLTPLPLPALVLTAAIGRIPGLVGAVWIGSQAEELGWQGMLIMGVLVVLGVFVAWRWGERIQSALMNLVQRRS